MTSRELIYVATRLTNEHPIGYLNNLQESIDAAVEIYRKGHYPMIPGLDFILYMNLRGDYGLNEKMPYEMGLYFQSKCDAILVHNGIKEVDGELVSEEGYKESSGVIAELQQAEITGQKIYWSLDEIPKVYSCAHCNYASTNRKSFYEIKKEIVENNPKEWIEEIWIKLGYAGQLICKECYYK